MYHAIRDAEAEGIVDRYDLCVYPASFAAQMRFLHEAGYTTLTMHQVANILAGYDECPVQPVALTFDDGTRDFCEVAYPILRSVGFVATVFVPTATIGDAKHMTAEQLRELAAQRIEIGSHSRDHRALSHLPKGQQEPQVRGSRLTLEAITGEPVISFSYPGGYHNEATLELLRLYGYRTAVTTVRGTEQNPEEPYLLCRVRVRSTHDLAKFARNIGAPPPTAAFPPHP